jgi:hypothetical protein
MTHSQAAFTRRQRVAVQRFDPVTFAPDWSDHGTIIDGKPQSVSPTSGDWYRVRFDHGGALCIHETQLRAV